MNNLNYKAKLLNAMVTGKNFEDKDIDNYIYASLSAPPIKIIDKCNSEDELDFMVECPNCGKHVNYGNDIFMLSGKLYCSSEGCRENLINKDHYLRSKYETNN